MFWVCVQSESSQLETKLSGIQVTSGVKRDSLLPRAEEMKDRNSKTSTKLVSVSAAFTQSFPVYEFHFNSPHWGKMELNQLKWNSLFSEPHDQILCLAAFIFLQRPSKHSKLSLLPPFATSIILELTSILSLSDKTWLWFSQAASQRGTGGAGLDRLCVHPPWDQGESSHWAPERGQENQKVSFGQINFVNSIFI